MLSRLLFDVVSATYVEVLPEKASQYYSNHAVIIARHGYAPRAEKLVM